MTNISLALLDMAGTTVLDSGVVEEAARQAIIQTRRQGLPHDFDVRFRSARGGTKVRMFQDILGDAEEALRAYGAFEQQLVNCARRGRFTPVTGVTDVIKELHNLGLKVALATGFSRPVREAILDGLSWNGLVDLSIGFEDYGRGRPAPDSVLTAVLRLEIDAVQNVATVGDTRNDLEAGNRAGAGLIVGVLTGAHNREELSRVRHDAILDSIADLPALIRR